MRVDQFADALLGVSARCIQYLVDLATDLLPPHAQDVVLAAEDALDEVLERSQCEVEPEPDRPTDRRAGRTADHPADRKPDEGGGQGEACPEGAVDPHRTESGKVSH